MDRASQEVEEGELLAYLDGKRLLHVKEALQQSAELRERLEQIQQSLQRFERLFRNAQIRKRLL